MKNLLLVILLFWLPSTAMAHEAVSDVWVTPIRLDPSGLAAIPGTSSLMVVNDQGYSEYERNKPMLQILRPGSLMTSNAVIRNSDNKNITGDLFPDKKWDGEDVTCVLLEQSRIGCALVSGKRDHFIWIESDNLEDASYGNFVLKRSFNFSEYITTQLPHPKDNPYELETLEMVSSSSHSVTFIGLSRGPVDKHDGTGNYAVYKLILDLEYSANQFPEIDKKGFSISHIGNLKNSVCPYDPEIEMSFTSFMRVSALFKSKASENGFMVCAHEELSDYSYLVPIQLSEKGIQVDDRFSSIPIGYSDIKGFKPQVMKVEGLACFNENLLVAIDADHKDAGVFTLSDRFSQICRL